MKQAFLLLIVIGSIAGTGFFAMRGSAPVSDSQTAASALAIGSSFASSTSGTEVLEAKAPSGTSVGPEVISVQAPPPPGYVEYRNEKYGFSYYHSLDAKLTEYDEGSGAMTLVHENFVKVRGFQVFIVPYNEPLISEERFKMDVPSGVRKNVTDTTLDGVRAVTFNSYDPMLGDTREIWVIHNGYLYEITTFSGVGNWFTPLIQSWRFI
jgi:hypothetical protein